MSVFLALTTTLNCADWEQRLIAAESGLVPVVNMTHGTVRYRDYERPLLSSERDDIRYVVTSLANNSMVTILFKSTSIEQAGQRIDSVHPLQFLQCIFTNEELKAGVHNIRARPQIWKDFFGGLRSSLQKEASDENLDQYIAEFTQKVGVAFELVRPLVEARRWEAFVDVLLKTIPRNNTRNRYDD